MMSEYDVPIRARVSNRDDTGYACDGCGHGKPIMGRITIMLGEGADFPESHAPGRLCMHYCKSCYDRTLALPGVTPVGGGR